MVTEIVASTTTRCDSLEVYDLRTRQSCLIQNNVRQLAVSSDRTISIVVAKDEVVHALEALRC
jgi:tricorn protease-like protein